MTETEPPEGGYHLPSDDASDHTPCESCGGCLTCRVHWHGDRWGQMVIDD